MAREIRLIVAGLFCGLLALASLAAFQSRAVAPATGLAFALLVIWGPSCARSLAPGLAIASIAWALHNGGTTHWGHVAGGGAIEGLTLALGGILGLRIFRRGIPGLRWFHELRDISWFVLAAAVTATISAAGAWFSGMLTMPGNNPGMLFLAHFSGILVVAPPILFFRETPRAPLTLRQRLEFFLVLAIMLSQSVLLFGPEGARAPLLAHLESLLLLPIFWAAIRLPARLASLLASVGSFAVWCGATGELPADNDAAFGEHAGLLLSSAMMIMTLIGLVLTRKRDTAMKDAREAERRFRELLEQADLLAVILDIGGRIVFCNARLAELTGWSRAELMGRGWFELTAPGDTHVGEVFRKMIAEGQAVPHFENEIQIRSGRRLIIRWNNVLLRDSDGGVVGTASLGENVAERRTAEEQLRLQSAALAASANGVFISDRSGHIVWLNDAFSRISGYPQAELLGQTPRLLQSGRHDTSFYRGIWNAVLAGRVWSGEVTNRRKNGRLYQASMTISPVTDATGLITHFIAVQQDVTEQRDLEHRVRQAENMESVGRLAGGIAHAFNNLLQVVLGAGEFLLSQLPQGDRLRSEVQEIERAAKQAAGLTNQLLAFSRQQVITPRQIHLNQILRGTESMVRRLISEDIVISYELDEELPWVQADPVQVEQLILNLASNASDAMPNGGRLLVSTSREILTADRLPPGENLRAGPYACLTVRDTGPVLNADQRTHVFEPFFSRTGQSHLSGLGLAVVDGIVRLHNGFIRVESDESTGTTFRVGLPALPALQPPPYSSSPAAPQQGLSRKILLVEDDEPVRKLALRILSRAGYSVIQAASASEARMLFDQQGRDISALFTDVVLTDGSGLDLVADFSQRRNDLAVLVASGYTDDKARWSQIRRQGYRYMQKPYTAEQLLANLREILPKPS